MANKFPEHVFPDCGLTC